MARYIVAIRRMGGPLQRGRAGKYIVAGDHKSLADMAALGDDGATSIPTPEHYIPLLYVIALQRPDDPIVFLTDGIALRSISMMSVAVG